MNLFLKGESGEKTDSNISLPALTKVDRNLFICRLYKKQRGHKMQVNAGMSEKPTFEHYVACYALPAISVCGV